MILSTVRLVVAAPQKSEVLRMLRVFMGHTTAKAGCAGFSLVQDVANPEALTICDRWVTREALEHKNPTSISESNTCRQAAPSMPQNRCACSSVSCRLGISRNSARTRSTSVRYGMTIRHAIRSDVSGTQPGSQFALRLQPITKVAAIFATT